MTGTRFLLLAATFVAISVPAAAQGLRPGASGRATTSVRLTAQGQQPATITIDYGQPHARGRAVAGALAGDLGQVWRLGANEMTVIKSDVDLMIGNLTVPKGTHSLAAETSATGEWRLIVNRKIDAWGIPYDASTEMGRTALTSKALTSPVEAFTMWLVPATDGSASGVIRFAWGTREFSAPWRVK